MTPDRYHVTIADDTAYLWCNDHTANSDDWIHTIQAWHGPLTELTDALTAAAEHHDTTHHPKEPRQ